MDPKAVVRARYERAAEAYLADRPQTSPDIASLDHLLSRLAPGARVLDAGCGAGVPIAQRLSRSHRVVGVDFSERQLALAAQHVPTIEPVCQDLTRLGLAPCVFDAIVSYYAIIHIPRVAGAGFHLDQRFIIGQALDPHRQLERRIIVVIAQAMEIVALFFIQRRLRMKLHKVIDLLAKCL